MVKDELRKPGVDHLGDSEANLEISTLECRRRQIYRNQSKQFGLLVVFADQLSGAAWERSQRLWPRRFVCYQLRID
jgi:hypothetical protein